MNSTETQQAGSTAAESERIGLIEDIDLIIFDMDGVIADTAEGHKLAWREYMGRFGREFTDEQFHAIFGTGNRELCPILFPERNLSEAEIQQIGEEKEALFREKSRRLLRTYPGFERFLDTCDQHNLPMAVGSSACRENVDFVLGELGIVSRFRAIVSADDVENAKPAPDIFLRAAELAGVAPERALVLEDSMMGIAAARNAGMQVIGLATTHAKSELGSTDLTANDFIELMELTGI